LGVILVLFGTLGFLSMAYGTVTGEQPFFPNQEFSTDAVIEGTIIVVTGSWLLVAAHQWWKGRWMTAIALCVLLGFALWVVEMTGVDRG